MPELFHRLPRNAAGIFCGRNLWWQVAAIALTAGLVWSGADWKYFCATRTPAWQALAWPAIRLGFLLPIWGPLILLTTAVVNKNRALITTAWALGQAALLGYLTSCFYKAFTGRLPPPFAGRSRLPAAYNNSMIDMSHGFQFGFWKGGVFWGWPSSHTAVAFAMSLCLVTLRPKPRILLPGALLYAFYIGLGTSMTIHWFSDSVAGSLIGVAIGTTVGKSFRDKLAAARG